MSRAESVVSLVDCPDIDSKVESLEILPEKPDYQPKVESVVSLVDCPEVDPEIETVDAITVQPEPQTKVESVVSLVDRLTSETKVEPVTSLNDRPVSESKTESRFLLADQLGYATEAASFFALAAEPVSKSGSESETEFESEWETESESHTETESETQSEPRSQTPSDTRSETDPYIRPESDLEAYLVDHPWVEPPRIPTPDESKPCPYKDSYTPKYRPPKQRAPLLCSRQANRSSTSTLPELPHDDHPFQTLKLYNKYSTIYEVRFPGVLPDAYPWTGHIPKITETSDLPLPPFSEKILKRGAIMASRRQDFTAERVLENGEKIRLGDYTLGQTLGEGEFGKVKIGWKAAVGAQVAVKIIRREKLDSSARLAKVHREIAILKQLDHPNIVRLHEMVETKQTIGIILEYASGGELFDYILQQRFLKDEKARRLFAQLVSGVGYLHRNGIIHRDLKLENLLLDSNKNIIITDFGFANTFDPTDREESKTWFTHKGNVSRDEKQHLNGEANEQTGYKRGDLMNTSCGSPCYAAPELVVSDGLYSGRKVDIWSCGVILYAMLAGYLPFDDDPDNPEGDNINLLYKYICSTPLIFPDYVTPHARDILRRILVPDPKKRADLFEIARHSWLSDYAHLVEAVTSRVPLTDEEYQRTKALKVPIKDMASVEGMIEPVQTISRAKSDKFAYRDKQTSETVGGPTPEKRKPAPKAVQPPRTVNKHYGVAPKEPDQMHSAPKDYKVNNEYKRRTVQVEYVKPGSRPSDIREESQFEIKNPDQAWRTESQRIRDKYNAMDDELDRPMPPAKDLPPSTVNNTMRSGRHIPRATSESTTTTMGHGFHQRPNTGGSLGGPSRLPPSRGSYGQPSAPAVSNETAHGQVSGPDPQRQARRTASGRLVMPPSVESAGQKGRGHKRSSTVGNISEKFITRMGSIGRKATRPTSKPDKSYPPTSMKPVNADEAGQPRKSVESRRSFGFGRKASDSSPNQEKRHSRRFSLLPTRTKSEQPSPQATQPPSTAQSTGDAQGEEPDVSLPGKHKRFSDAYEQQSSGSSGAARRVMDMFRRRR